MSGCCGPLCSKTFVILYNFIFWISGIAIVVGGVLVLYDVGFSHLYTLYNQNPEKYPSEFLFYGAYVIIGLGGLILFVGFFGCCGALQESKCMLGTYIFFLIVICFAEAVVSLGCVYCHFSYPSNAKDKLRDNLVTKYNLTEYGELTTAINYAQATFKCCGITGSKDHDELKLNRTMNMMHSHSFSNNQNQNLYPSTCCVLSTEPQIEEIWLKPNVVDLGGCQDQITPNPKSRYTQGCWKDLALLHWLYTLIVAGVSGGLAILQIFGILFSLCLIRNIGEET